MVRPDLPPAWLLAPGGALAALAGAAAIAGVVRRGAGGRAAAPPDAEGPRDPLPWARQAAALLLGFAFVLAILAVRFGLAPPVAPLGVLTGAAASALSARLAAGIRTGGGGARAAFLGGSAAGLATAGVLILEPLAWLVLLLRFSPLAVRDIAAAMLWFCAGPAVWALFAGRGEEEAEAADLRSSFSLALAAAAALGGAAAGSPGVGRGARTPEELALRLVLLPFAVAGAGAAASILGALSAARVAGPAGADAHRASARGLNVAGLLGAAGSYLALYGIAGPDFQGLFWSMVAGLGAALLLGRIPEGRAAAAAGAAPAPEAVLGRLFPVAVVAAALVLAYAFAGGFRQDMSLGLYGVGLAAAASVSVLAVPGGVAALRRAPTPPAAPEGAGQGGSRAAGVPAAAGFAARRYAAAAAALAAISLLGAWSEAIRAAHVRDAARAYRARGGRPGEWVAVEERAGSFERRDPVGIRFAILPRGAPDGQAPWAVLAVPGGGSDESLEPLGRPERLAEGGGLVRADRAPLEALLRFHGAHPLDPRMLAGLLLGAVLAMLLPPLVRASAQGPGAPSGPLVPALVLLVLPAFLGALAGPAGVAGLLAGAAAGGLAAFAGRPGAAGAGAAAKLLAGSAAAFAGLAVRFSGPLARLLGL